MILGTMDTLYFCPVHNVSFRTSIHGSHSALVSVGVVVLVSVLGEVLGVAVLRVDVCVSVIVGVGEGSG